MSLTRVCARPPTPPLPPSPPSPRQLVEDSSTVRVRRERQYDLASAQDQNLSSRGLELRFGELHLGQPTQVEDDGSTTNVFPHQARLRGLTYSSALFVDIEQRTVDMDEDDDEDEVWDSPAVVKEVSEDFRVAF